MNRLAQLSIARSLRPHRAFGKAVCLPKRYNSSTSQPPPSGSGPSSTPPSPPTSSLPEKPASTEVDPVQAAAEDAAALRASLKGAAVPAAAAAAELAAHVDEKKQRAMVVPPGRVAITYEYSDLIGKKFPEEENVQEEEAEEDEFSVPKNTWPNLMRPDALMDLVERHEVVPTKAFPYGGCIEIRNDPSIFEADALQYPEAQVKDLTPEWQSEVPDEEEDGAMMDNLPYTRAQIRKLHTYCLVSNYVAHQSSKGKIRSMYTLVVVGNGDGLVGYGEGKDDDAGRARMKAQAQAIRNMDTVERFEKRTIWTEMEAKLGATQIFLRPRPVGFGLHCNPNIHQVLKAAGIKDISAKVWGSRNPMNVIKALFRMLHAGNAPLAMGDGMGGKGVKLNRGSGLISKGEVERARGRKLIDLRT